MKTVARLFVRSTRGLLPARHRPLSLMLEPLEARELPAFLWPTDAAYPSYNDAPPAYLADTVIRRDYEQSLTVGANRHTFTVQATNRWRSTLDASGAEVRSSVVGSVTFRSETWVNGQLDPTTSTGLYLDGPAGQSIDAGGLTSVLGGALPPGADGLWTLTTQNPDWGQWSESDSYVAYTLGYVNGTDAYSFRSGASRTSNSTTTRTNPNPATQVIVTTDGGTWEDETRTFRPTWYMPNPVGTYDLNAGESGTYTNTRTDTITAPTSESPATASTVSNWLADGRFWNISSSYRSYGWADGSDPNRAWGWDRTSHNESGTLLRRGSGTAAYVPNGFNEWARVTETISDRTTRGGTITESSAESEHQYVRTRPDAATPGVIDVGASGRGYSLDRLTGVIYVNGWSRDTTWLNSDPTSDEEAVWSSASGVATNRHEVRVADSSLYGTISPVA